MAEKDIQLQINEMNQKLDLVLHYIDQQRISADESKDLLSDINLIGKDVFKATVEELDHADIEIDVDLMKQMFFRLMKNLNNINQAVESLESMNDLLQDVKPITRDLVLNLITKVDELEQKGYLAFFMETTKIMDNIIRHFSTEDVAELAENVVTILETVKNMTQPEMMSAINNAVTVFQHLESDNIPSYSLWRTFREMNTPEMKKGIGFMITFLKNVANTNNQNNQ